MSDSDTDRDSIEVLAAEFVERCRCGENPTIEEYAREHAELASRIRELFPTIAAMERLKLQRERCGNGRSPLGNVELERLGDFRIIREIGRGGMGIVYEAEQESLGRRVAVKVLPRQSLLERKQLRRFQREARTAAKLHHTNIVPVFGVGEQDGYHYYVMQLIHGVGLDEILPKLAQATCCESTQALAPTALDAPAFGDARGRESTDVARALLSSQFLPRDVTAALDDSSENGMPSPEGTQQWSDGVDVQSSANGGDGRSQIASTKVIENETTPTNDCGRDGADDDTDTQVAHRRRAQLGRRYWQNAAGIGVQAARALQYAHGQGTLHRDIKPANLILDRHGIVWVADFGLARAMEQDGLSQTANIVGTLRFMAPERFRGQSDARSDVYSLGLTLYELLTLQPAFSEPDRGSLLQRVTNGEPTRPRKLNPQVPRDLETIVLKAIARESALRYQTAGQLADDLEAFLDDRPIQARQASVAERLWRWCRRNRLVAGLAGTALTLLILVAVVSTVLYFKTKSANVEVRNALAGQKSQRQKAEATSKLALEALDGIFEQFAPNRIQAAHGLTIEGEEGEELQVPIQPVLSKPVAGLLENLLKFYDRLAVQESQDPEYRQKAAAANRRVGDIHARLGQYQKSLVAYGRAIDSYRKLNQQEGTGDSPHTPAFTTEIARIHNEVGNVYRSTQEIQKARESHLQALEILGRQTPPDTTPAETRYELARTYYFLGRRQLMVPGIGPSHPGPPGRGRGFPGRFGPPGKGGSWKRDSLQGPPRESGPSARFAGGHHFRGRIGRYDQGSRQYLDKAIRMLTELVDQNPSVPDYRHLLAVCYRELPRKSWFRDRQQTDEALDKSTQILEALVRDFPDVADYRHDLSQSYAAVDVRGPFASDEERQTVKERLNKALEISASLVAEHPNVPDYAVSQVQLYSKLGTVLLRSKQSEQAEASLRRAVELEKSLVERFSRTTSLELGLAINQQLLARLLRDRDQLDEARSLLETSITGVKRILENNPDARFLNGPLHQSYRALADVLQRMGKDDLAKEASTQAAQLRPGPGRKGMRKPQKNVPTEDENNDQPRK